MNNPVDISNRLAGYKRILICGGPRTGKSTLAVRLGERHGIPVRFGDSLVGSADWSQCSQIVSEWMDESGPQIIDGVVAVRAMRKWLKRNLEGSPGFVVVYLRDHIQVPTDKQISMAKGIRTIWKEIEPELIRRGIQIIQRDT